MIEEALICICAALWGFWAFDGIKYFIYERDVPPINTYDTPETDPRTDDPQTLEEARECYAAHDEEYTLLDYESDVERILADETDSDDEEEGGGEETPRVSAALRAEAKRDVFEEATRRVEKRRIVDETTVGGIKVTSTAYVYENTLPSETTTARRLNDQYLADETFTMDVVDGTDTVATLTDARVTHIRKTALGVRVTVESTGLEIKDHTDHLRSKRLQPEYETIKR